jgi:hypothetical protein
MPDVIDLQYDPVDPERQTIACGRNGTEIAYRFIGAVTKLVGYNVDPQLGQSGQFFVLGRGSTPKPAEISDSS